jgi:hypothetical protein
VVATTGSQKLNAGGTGKIAYDPKQRDIRAFFSGAAKTIAVEHCESDTRGGIDGEAKN